MTGDRAEARAPLPPLLVITDTGLARGRAVPDVVAAAVDGGCRAVLVRDKALEAAARADLAAAVAAVVHPRGGLVLVASDVRLATEVGADGVHLAATDRPARAGSLVGRSCHSDGELAAAAAEGCDYALLSPIFATASKPGYGPALGTAALSGTPLPVWALGGITNVERAASCRAVGASGIAVMGAVMGATDPAGAVADLLAGWQQAVAPRRGRVGGPGPQRRGR